MLVYGAKIGAVKNEKYILGFDTANETIVVAVGRLGDDQCVEPIATREISAHRASNTKLLPTVDALLSECEIAREQISCVCAGRGPGSFTGVRICLATAKGVAAALGVGLVGINTLDIVAWALWQGGARGHAYVVADAMRKELYPALFEISDNGVKRLTNNSVAKATDVAAKARNYSKEFDNLMICGDGLVKYEELFQGLNIVDSEMWQPSGIGLLLTAQDMWQNGLVDFENSQKHDPAFVLPVYTRLSDAEENERIKIADNTQKDLNSGVQHSGTSYRPMAAGDVDQVVKIEDELMGSDAWNPSKFHDDLKRKDRTWWVAEVDGKIAGYAGALICESNCEILKIAVCAQHQKCGIGSELMSLIGNDARDLGATKTSLEVRSKNEDAIKFYESLGLKQAGVRKNYYKDDDACVMTGPLTINAKALAGMQIQEGANSHNTLENLEHPLILAIESSCDETAAAITCNGKVVADEVASQIDFHKRFGGVVPEIASRKHIEAISGLVQVCMQNAAKNLGIPALSFGDLDAIAVTYAPGLVGALVVGMAFAKGAAWAANKPLIGVNHLEGHLYANKLATDSSIELPAIASIISGGNTILISVENWGKYKTLGSTIDDAVGEAFDKVAKALGLGYPGGPVISKFAAQGNPKAIRFPRAMMHSGDLRFSLSGLKTSVITHINKCREAGEELNFADICASFQAAVIDVQVAKAKTALIDTHSKTFMFGGGVAANPELRKAYQNMCDEIGVKLVMPPLSACGDNAAMIALVANDRYKQGRFFDLAQDVAAHSTLDKPY